MDEKRKVVGVYVRVSTTKQDITNQLDQLRPYCEKMGWDPKTGRPSHERLETLDLTCVSQDF